MLLINNTTTFTFTTDTTSAISNATFIATACKDKIIKKKVAKVYKYTGY